MKEAAGPHASSPSLELPTPEAAFLKIPSFELEHRTELEMLLNEHAAEIRQRPLLIIDVRGNGGGGDSTYEPLIPLFYADPIHVVGVEARATPENVAALRWELDHVVPSSAADARRGIQREIAAMEAHLGMFVPSGADATLVRAEVLPRPVRVAILIDRGCASSCEQFLLAARQSRKVALVGTRSAGVLDYANVGVFFLPSGERFLGIPMTRTRRPLSERVDGAGIAPMVALDESEAARLDARSATALIEARVGVSP